MRIMQVLPYLEKGGAERVVIELCNSFSENGEDVTLLLISPVDSALNERNLSANVKVVFLYESKRNRIRSFTKILPWIVGNRKYLREFDIVHCHLTFGLIFGTCFSAMRFFLRLRPPKLVLTCHMVGMDGFIKFLNMACSVFFDAFVLVGWNRDWRRFSHGKFGKNIHMIPNGITLSDSSRKEKKTTRKSNYAIGAISRLVAERKPELILQTFSEIRKEGSEKFSFIFAGDGPELESLTKLERELKLHDSVEMLGLVIEPGEVLQKLDAYVTISVASFPGIAALEAILHGVPVFGIQLMADYSCKKSDIIWSSHDPAEVAKKIVNILSDSAQLVKYRQRQYTQATNDFNVTVMMKRYQEIYGV
jgi:glycosyltransferase involved in cell wall biosynthesis